MMLRNAATALLVVSLVTGGAVSCGRYGSPVRADSPEQAEPSEQQAPEESS